MDFMQTEHVYIRRMIPEDWSDLYENLSSEESQRFQIKGPYTKEACIEEIHHLSQFNTAWSVCLKSNRMVIGFVLLEQVPPQNARTFKLHFNFDQTYLIHGFVKEANTRMVQYAFEELQAHRVIGLSCAQDSLSSKEFLKVGMRKEGMLQKALTFRTTTTGKPIWWDINCFAILKDDWIKTIK